VEQKQEEEGEDDDADDSDDDDDIRIPRSYITKVKGAKASTGTRFEVSIHIAGQQQQGQQPLKYLGKFDTRGEAKAAYRTAARELGREGGDNIPANYIKETTTAGGRQRFGASIYLRGVVPPKTIRLGTFDTRADAEAGAYSRPLLSSTGSMFGH
jgi:hypothetical protein